MKVDYKNIIKVITIFAISLFTCSNVFAQADKKEVRRGNRMFKKGNFYDAEIDYRKALAKDSTSFAATYNLANALYKQKKVEEATKFLDNLKEQAPLSSYASDYYYNRGNCAVQAKDWQAAVDSYKQSLLRNPGDMDAKENYIYAKKKLEEQQQQQQQQQNQDNKDQNKDQDKQDKNKDQNKDNKDNKDQNKDQNKDNQDQNKDKNNQDKQQNKGNNGQQPKISPQQAQQMLKAMQAKEKQTQDKVKKEKAEAMKSKQKTKNW